MEKRYGTLRFIVTVYKILGVIVLALTLLAVLSIWVANLAGGTQLHQWWRGPVMPMMGGIASALMFSVGALIYGGGLSVTLYGVGEAIYLLIALEENTRATVQLLQRQVGS